MTSRVFPPWSDLNPAGGSEGVVDTCITRRAPDFIFAFRTFESFSRYEYTSGCKIEPQVPNFYQVRSIPRSILL